MPMRHVLIPPACSRGVQQLLRHVSKVKRRLQNLGTHSSFQEAILTLANLGATAVELDDTSLLRPPRDVEGLFHAGTRRFASPDRSSRKP